MSCSYKNTPVNVYPQEAQIDPKDSDRIPPIPHPKEFISIIYNVRVTQKISLQKHDVKFPWLGCANLVRIPWVAWVAPCDSH